MASNKNNLKLTYTQNLSLLRIITNSTPSVIAIIIFLVFLPQFFGTALYTNTYILVSSLVVEVGLLAYISLHCYSEYRYSLFFVDEEKICFHRFNRPKKLDTIMIKDVKEITIKSFNVVVIAKNGQRLVLEYLAHPKELMVKLKQLCNLK